MKELKNLFRGRISRRQWVFGNLLALAILFLIGLVQFSIFSIFDSFEVVIALAISLGLLAWGVLFLIGISLNVRRLHDIGHSGWTIFFAMIPLVNVFFFFYLLIKPGVLLDNKYGNLPIKRRVLEVVLNTDTE
ncbi:MAG: DUF805 domain-containing protein [bacterium]|nr:DUF805 domain-containing protein [bacterium]